MESRDLIRYILNERYVSLFEITGVISKLSDQ